MIIANEIMPHTQGRSTLISVGSHGRSRRQRMGISRYSACMEECVNAVCLMHRVADWLSGGLINYDSPQGEEFELTIKFVGTQ